LVSSRFAAAPGRYAPPHHGPACFILLRWKTGIRRLPPIGLRAITGFLLLCVGNGGVCWRTDCAIGVTALWVAMVTLWMVLVDWWRPGATARPAGYLFGVFLGIRGAGRCWSARRIWVPSGRVDRLGRRSCCGIVCLGLWLAVLRSTVLFRVGMLSMSMQCWQAAWRFGWAVC